MEAIPLLKQLSETDGLAGYEEPVREFVSQTWQPLVDEMRVGGLGSLIGLKRGVGPEPRRKIMLAGHMDEVGLMVAGIEKGFLRVRGFAGADRRVALGQEVIVHAARDLPGIVASRPPHVLPEDERTKTVEWDKMFVDVGLPPAEVEELVSVGDLVAIRCEMVELKNRRVAGKAMDDRASVAAITLALDELRNVGHVWDVYAVATTQEETGLKGATTSAYGIEPDLAIALDVTFGNQPGLRETEVFPLGEGPTIAVGPNLHPAVVAHLRKVADEHEVPYHIEPAPGRTGTDAWALQISREGVPTALIGIPTRYMHQPVEMLAVQDVERAGRLLAAFIASLDAEFLETIVWKDTVESE